MCPQLVAKTKYIDTLIKLLLTRVQEKIENACDLLEKATGLISLLSRRSGETTRLYDI